MRFSLRAFAWQRRSALLLSLVVLVAFGAWLHVRRDLPWQLWSADARQYADLARRLAAGRGFTTGILYPIAVGRGTGPEHPSLLVPPLWSLAAAGIFLATGPDERALHVGALLAFLAAVAASTALGARLAGGAAGAVAGLATSLSPQVLTYAALPVTECFFAFWVLVVFALAARRADAFWVGGACGLACLTRHNGVLLLPVAFGMLLAWRPKPTTTARLALRLCVGFAIAMAPWWIRNFLVTGDPFFSYSEVYLQFGVALGRTGRAASLLFYLDPPHDAEAWHRIGAKAVEWLPQLLCWTPGTLGFPALLGVVLGCVRRDRLCLGFVALLLLNLLLLGFTIAGGRYLVPLAPTLFALGAAAWWRHGGRLRVAALALMLAAPWLPAHLSEAPDVALHRQIMEDYRTAFREDGAAAREMGAERAGVRRCVAPGSLVVAADATRLAWDAEAIAIYRPARDADFWKLVDELPVAWLQIAPRDPLAATEALRERFRPRPDCARDLYERVR